MAVRLGEVALVLTGLVLTRAQGAAGSAVEAPVIGLRDVGEALASRSDLDRIKVSPRIAERAAVAVGDVVVTARGANVRAVVIDVDHAGAMIGPNLLVVRPDPSRLVASVLAAYMRLPGVQAALLGARAGTAMPSLTVKDVSRLELVLPSLERQRDLAHILDLAVGYRAALLRAVECRDRVCAELLSMTLGPVRGARHG